MTFIVTDACIRCKLMDCVVVCPVDCFYEGENMLAIKPDECIDCGVCVPECPIDAIKPDSKDTPDRKWAALNAKYAEIWPRITIRGEPPADEALFRTETDKLARYFSEAAGPGDKGRHK